MRSTTDTPVLVHIPYSPWSDKARWALEHHGIAHERRPHVPMIGAPALRLRTRNWTGRISAPTLIAGGEAISDSYEIARWAERHGSGVPLFPAGAERDIERWNERSEELARAGRARVTARALEDPEALRESVPPPLNRAGAVADAVGRMGARFLARKYRFSVREQQGHERAMREVLDVLREALGSEGEYLLGHFTFADVAMAAALQLVEPVDDRHIRLGPATRGLWTDPTLASDYPELLFWRDRIYDRHR